MAHNAIDWLTRRWRRGSLHDKPLAVLGHRRGVTAASGRVKRRQLWRFGAGVIEPLTAQTLGDAVKKLADEAHGGGAAAAISMLSEAQSGSTRWLRELMPSWVKTLRIGEGLHPHRLQQLECYTGLRPCDRPFSRSRRSRSPYTRCAASHFVPSVLSVSRLRQLPASQAPRDLAGGRTATFHGETRWAGLDNDEDPPTSIPPILATAVEISVASLVVSSAGWPSRTQPVTSTGLAGHRRRTDRLLPTRERRRSHSCLARGSSMNEYARSR